MPKGKSAARPLALAPRGALRAAAAVRYPRQRGEAGERASKIQLLDLQPKNIVQSQLQWQAAGISAREMLCRRPQQH